MKIKVLGTGCKSCKKLFEEIDKYIKENNVDAEVEYSSDLQVMIGYGIMTAPAVVIDEKVVSTGKELSKKEIEKLLAGEELSNSNTSCGCGSC